MTPETLHQRIMLHELRTILLDETREGTQIPPAMRSMIEQDPHAVAPYLVWADWFDERGDELGELCRVQCELIGIYDSGPSAFAAGSGIETHLNLDVQVHQFKNDADVSEFLAQITGNETAKHTMLLKRRWEIVKGLYPPLTIEALTEYLNSDNQVEPRRLGRTTRMLTDVLRYCCLNEGKQVMVLGRDSGHASELRRATNFLISELHQLPERPSTGWPSIDIYGNEIHFAGPGRWGLARTSESPTERPGYEYDITRGQWLRVETQEPDITFTDHAVRTRESVEDEIDRRFRAARGNQP